MVCELATPRGSLFTPLDHTLPYSHGLHSSLLVHSPEHIPPSSFLAHSPGPHTSLLVHSLDHTPPSWFTPWAELLPPVSLAWPNSTLLPPGSLSCVPTPLSWFTALGPHASLLVHSPEPPLLPHSSLPRAPTPPYSPGPHSSLLVHSPGSPLLPLGGVVVSAVLVPAR